jgi:tetratricopeptide (TPR) repeat protein
MKIKKILFFGTLLVSICSFAQKDELKALKKIYDKDTPSASDVTDYKIKLSKLEPLATEEGDKVYYNYYKSILPQMEIAALGVAPSAIQLQKIFTPSAVSDLITSYNATLEYEKKTGKKVFTDDIKEDITIMKPMLVSAAVQYGEVKKYNEASSILFSVYQLDKKDQEKLYYAANYAVTANNYDDALKYYLELKALNYSGEGTQYYATNKSNKNEEYFNSKEERGTYIKLGTHEKPRDEKVESKRGEIYKNIALIYVNKGKKEEAKQAYADARKINPDDNSLLLNEANLYLTLNDFDTYTKLVNEALAKDPNNVELVFNLGVISGNANKLDAAEGYYKKAIAIDPKYFNAYLNLAELKMRSDQKYVDEINKLGTSDKDLKRYEVVKAERNKNFLAILPILEKAFELDSTNEPAKKTLLSVYKALEMTEKVKEMKAKM